MSPISDDVAATVDLDRYPLHEADSNRLNALVAGCRHDVEVDGMFNLPGLLRPGAPERIVAGLRQTIDERAFLHSRAHNIYFSDSVDGVPADDPALARVTTINRTICADQMAASPVVALYRWPPLIDFLARALGKPALYEMDDPLACANVMSYRAGEALNWHFDRSAFTTTLLLQAPDDGGIFEYRSDLRSLDAPNHAGVAALLRGEDDRVRTLDLAAGTLNVFKGVNTAHRVTPVRGGRDRIIAVFSYYDTPGVGFSDDERIGFYGRAS